MTYEGSESVQNNLGKFTNQLQPKTKTFVREFKRIFITLYA